MFPIAILLDGDTSLALVTKPEDLPQGKAFTIILTNISPGISPGDQFQVADRVCKNILQAR